jgi:transcriptional regulator with XRE-family HTH domain
VTEPVDHSPKNLERLMGMHLIRQDELAIFIGTSRQTINNWTRGRTNAPAVATLKRLAQAFGIGLDDLMAEPKACLQAAIDAWDIAPVRVRHEVKDT